MQKKAKPFIDLLESKQLLSPEIVGELRKQVADSKTRLTPELLAKLLVDNGHLTKFQATKLIAELKEQSDAAQEEEGLGFAPEATEEEELGFAPEPDEPETSRQEPAEDQNIASIFTSDAKPNLVDAVDVEPVEIVEAVTVDATQPASEEVEKVEVVEVMESADSGLGGLDNDALGTPQPATPKPVRPNISTSNPWDSFRILGVGLILALFLVAGYFLLNWFIRGNAEDRLASANNSYESRSYETAANMYTEFAEDFPTSEEVSFARVRAGLSTLRQFSEGAPDPEIGLDTALDVLPAISEESALAEQRPEVAGVLIALAGKFNDRADAAETIEQRKHLMSRMDQLLDLTNDPRFVGANERNQQAPTLQRIEEDRQRILREINRDEELLAALAAFDQELAEQDTLAAYEVRQELISRYPSLEANEALQSRVKQASDVQQTLVKPGSLRPSLQEIPPTDALGSTYVLGHRSGRTVDRLSNQVVFTMVKGSVYGLDASDGNILWRKYVGREFKAEPIRLGETSDVDALVCRPERGHILRVDGLTGEDQWLVDFGSPIHLPVTEGDDLFVTSLDGHVTSLDLETGQTKWVTQLPQPVEISPGVAFGKPVLYVVAEHSNLYVISRNDGQCLEVFYLGHRQGSVAVAPKLLLGQLFVMENVNSNSAKLRILAASEAGVDLEDAQVPILVDGNMLVDPQIDGRKMVVQSDLGQILVLDIEPTLETQKVSVLASIPKNLLRPQLSWSVFSNNKLWVSDTRFTRFNLQVSLGKLSRAWTENDGDNFTGPPQRFGEELIIHTRRLRGNQGARVAAVNAADGQPIWEVDLGVPVTFLHAANDNQVDAVNSGGMLFGLDDRSLRSMADANPGKGRASMRFNAPVYLSSSVALLLNASRANQIAVYADRSRGDKLTVLSANFGNAKPSCDAVAVDRSVAIGLNNGQLLLFDPSNGSPVASPYQPAMQAGKRVTWNTPVYWSDSKTLVVASDLLKLVRLSVGKSLRPLMEKDLESPLSGPLCKLGNNIAAVRSNRTENALIVFDALSLDETNKIAIDGNRIAGPYTIDGGCVIQTSSKLTLVSEDGAKAWAIDFPASALVGSPVKAADGWLFACRSGQVWLIDTTHGTILGKTDAGQSLSSTPILTPAGMLVGSDEGAVLELPLPTAQPEAP